MLKEAWDGEETADGAENTLVCSICLEDTTSAFTSWCSSRHRDTCHPECAISYITSAVDSTIMGVAPILRCPCNHDQEGNTKHLIPYSTWSQHVPENDESKLLEKYQWKANMMLPFLCPNCHIQKTILLDYQLASGSDVSKTLEYEKLIKHEIDVEDYYQFIMKGARPPKDTAGGGSFDHDSWNHVFPYIQGIEDPVLRARLHLRYLKDFPTFRTKCCKSVCCWNCKSAQHRGKTCNAVMELHDNEIIECGRCGIQLTKGDGCDSIICVCRNNINWTEEKKNKQQIMSFCRDYPENTTDECARLFFRISHGPAINVPTVWREEAQGDARKIQQLNHGEWKDKMDALYGYRKKYARDVDSRLVALWAHHKGYAASLALLHVKPAESEKCKALTSSSETLSLRLAERIVPCLTAVKMICSSVAQQRRFTSSMMSPAPREGSTPAEIFALHHRKEVKQLMKNLLTDHALRGGSHSGAGEVRILDAFYSSDDHKARASLSLFEGTSPGQKSRIVHGIRSFSDVFPWGKDVMQALHRWYLAPQLSSAAIKMARGERQTRLLLDFLEEHGDEPVNGNGYDDEHVRGHPGMLLLSRALELVWYNNDPVGGEARRRPTADGDTSRRFAAPLLRKEYVDERADFWEANQSRPSSNDAPPSGANSDDGGVDSISDVNSSRTGAGASAGAGDVYSVSMDMEGAQREKELAALHVVTSREYRTALNSKVLVVDASPAASDQTLFQSAIARSTTAGAGAGAHGAGRPPSTQDPPRFNRTAIISTNALLGGRSALTPPRGGADARVGRRDGTAPSREVSRSSSQREWSPLLEAVRSREPRPGRVPPPPYHPHGASSGQTHSDMEGLGAGSTPALGHLHDSEGKGKVESHSHESGINSGGENDLGKELTWRALWDSSLWTLRYRSRVAVREFERTHGENSCTAAACLLHDAETSSNRHNSLRRYGSKHLVRVGAAYDYARSHVQEMSAWYKANDEAFDPLVRTMHSCQCVPRHAISFRGVCASSILSQGREQHTSGLPESRPHPHQNQAASRCLQCHDAQYFAENPRFLGGYGTTTSPESMFSWALVPDGRKGDHDDRHTSLPVSVVEGEGPPFHRTQQEAELHGQRATSSQRARHDALTALRNRRSNLNLTAHSQVAAADTQQSQRPSFQFSSTEAPQFSVRDLATHFTISPTMLAFGYEPAMGDSIEGEGGSENGMSLAPPSGRGGLLQQIRAGRRLRTTLDSDRRTQSL
jgi:hypothetical protein